ncbi:hypothetical protein Adt_05872 [Abeliophyllum distichum]|uniref:Uncharacterized protein n=1 Tax=Abeliophyllum distichum TaxID=126358 RepID=A0ABD1V5Q6_9LAMI
MAEMSMARWLILNKEVYNTVVGYEIKFSKEVAKSKKLSEDLKAMGLETAQLELDKRDLQFKMDLVVAKEADMKAKYEIELKTVNECLKQVGDQKRAVEASKKCIEESQKLAEDQAFMVETTIATSNNNMEAVVAEKDKQLVEAEEEVEKVKAERADNEARAVLVYNEEFENTPEYMQLTYHFMMAGEKQLVERIGETYPKWDISFLRYAPDDLTVHLAPVSTEVPPNSEP